jgi:predicted NBD/HSP70 family sugar kinase
MLKVKPKEKHFVTQGPNNLFRKPNCGMRRIDLKDVQLGSNNTGRMINRDILLRLIRTVQSISRVDLSRLSGLQRSTVSEISDQLLKEGWICEGPYRRTARGRHPQMLTLNDALAILAVDIHPLQAVVAMVDLNGRIISSSTIPIGTNPARAVESIVSSLKRLRDSYTNKSLVGIGVSMPGRVSAKTQRLVFAPNLGWGAYDLKLGLEEEMGLTVEIENAANSSLISELWFGRMEGVCNAALITVSEGIGAGILADGIVIRGHDGAAGEFGHIPLASPGPLCGCGQTGCWETLASNSAAVRYYTELVPNSSVLTFSDLLNLAVEGDPNAVKSLEKQAVFLGKGLRMLAYAFSPEVVLVAGALVSIWDKIAPIIEKELANPPLPGNTPRLQPAYEGGLARLRGAAATLIQRHSGLHGSKLILASQMQLPVEGNAALS